MNPVGWKLFFRKLHAISPMKKLENKTTRDRHIFYSTPSRRFWGFGMVSYGSIYIIPDSARERVVPVSSSRKLQKENANQIHLFYKRIWDGIWL
jgi:hypothetical protein